LSYRDDIDRLSDQEGELCKQLEAEAAKDTNVKKVLEVLGRRVRPTQLSVHQKILGAHMEAVGPLLQEVSTFAESVVQDCVADRVYATVTAGRAGEWFDQQSPEGVE
jgi:hypothetical protein